MASDLPHVDRHCCSLSDKPFTAAAFRSFGEPFFSFVERCDRTHLKGPSFTPQNRGTAVRNNLQLPLVAQTTVKVLPGSCTLNVLFHHYHEKKPTVF